MNGLVLAFDMGNTRKSWIGKPITNFIGNGSFAGGGGVVNESGSYGTYSIVQLSNPGLSQYVLRQSGGAGGEYEIHPKTGVPSALNPNTTYCMSLWVALTPNFNGDSQTLHSRWYDGSGNPYTTGGNGTVYETKVVGSLTWERRYQTFTTPATTSGTYNWYVGYPTNGTTGFRYITGIQLEESSYPSPLVEGTRSATQSVLDLTGNNVMTVSNLTYNANGSFSFNNSSSVITIPNTTVLNPTTGLTIEAWVKFNGDSDDFIFEKGDVNTQYSLFSHSTDIVFRTYHAADGAYHTQNPAKSTVGVTNGVPVHIVGSWDGATKRIYINGVLKDSVAKAGALITRTTGAAIGRFGGTTTGYYFGGDIYKVAVYNRGLSATEIAQNFNALRGRYGI